jgi:hypothetical protein
MAKDGEVILGAVAAGESHEQLAANWGPRLTDVKKRLARMRDTFAAHSGPMITIIAPD